MKGQYNKGTEMGQGHSQITEWSIKQCNCNL